MIHIIRKCSFSEKATTSSSPHPDQYEILPIPIVDKDRYLQATEVWYCHTRILNRFHSGLVLMDGTSAKGCPFKSSAQTQLTATNKARIKNRRAVFTITLVVIFTNMLTDSFPHHRGTKLAWFEESHDARGKPFALSLSKIERPLDIARF